MNPGATGRLTAMVTRLKAGGRVDEDMPAGLGRRLLASGSDGVALRHDGEPSPLRMEEQVGRFETLGEELRSEGVVVASAGSHGTHHAEIEPGTRVIDSPVRP